MNNEDSALVRPFVPRLSSAVVGHRVFRDRRCLLLRPRREKVPAAETFGIVWRERTEAPGQVSPRNSPRARRGELWWLRAAASPCSDPGSLLRGFLFRFFELFVTLPGLSRPPGTMPAVLRPIAGNFRRWFFDRARP